MITQDMIAVFEDTRRIFSSDPFLQRRTEEAMAAARLYPEGFISPIRQSGGNPEVRVLRTTTFQCAWDTREHGMKTAVLNFANPHEPGGGVLRGARAQEESLCRCSNLYQTLAQPHFVEQYYGYHLENCDDLFSDRLVYSPGVMVIKSDDLKPRILECPFSVDVITCAAPYISLHTLHNEQELLEIYRSRIRNILEAAMANGVDILILGAFGCGAFNNNPRLMAQAFADLLIGQGYAAYFRKVVFAIKPTSRICPNVYAFEKEFESI